MRKGATIFFLLLVLFHICGYRWLIHHLQTQNAQEVEARVDRQSYSDDELISIKTTLHLPYFSGSAQFERVYGSITINGMEYEYVKRRVHNDTLELLCLPNKEKSSLQQLQNELTQTASGNNASLPQKKAVNFKLFSFDFVQPHAAMNVIQSTSVATGFAALRTKKLLRGSAGRLIKPPQGILA